MPGVPVAQGSMSAYDVGTRAVVTDQKRAVLKPWRATVTTALAAEGHAFGKDPVWVGLHFVLPRPASVKRRLPSTRPDLDKLARACLDALTDSGVVADDGQVVVLNLSKIYGTAPGVWITIDKVVPGPEDSPS